MSRVLIVMPLGNAKGGGERMLLHLMQQGRGKGIEWKVVFLEPGDLVTAVEVLGVPVTVIDAGRMREVHRLVAAARKIAGIAREFRADLILGWMGTGQLYGGLAAWMARLPAAWYQLDVPRTPGMIDKLAARLPARFTLALSKEGLDAQQQLVPRSPVRLVYPGVELERFDPSVLPSVTDARAQLGLPTERPIVGIVGRLQHWKGMHVLVDAWPDVLAHHPDALAVIVGGKHDFEPEYEAQLAQRIQAKGLTDSVRMVGFQADIPLWVQALDIFVHASRTEPFGIVVIEAMALGKPVIATDSGGPTEIITPGTDGLLTPWEDAPALAAAIHRYLADPALVARIGPAARERALQFSTVRYAANIIAAIQEFLP